MGEGLTHRVKRQFLQEKNWSFCGVYNSELKEEPPINWEGNMSKLFPNWRTTRLPSVPDHIQIQMPKQEKPWDGELQTEVRYQFIPIRVPV